MSIIPNSADAVQTTPPRRKVLQTAVGAGLGALGAPALVRAQGAPKIRIGYWPVAAGLPFFAAVEKGYFKARQRSFENLACVPL